MKDREMYPNQIITDADDPNTVHDDNNGTCRLYILLDETEFVDVDGPRFEQPHPADTIVPLEETHARGPAIFTGQTVRVCGPTVLLLGTTSKGSYFSTTSLEHVRADIDDQVKAHGRPLTHVEKEIYREIASLSMQVDAVRSMGMPAKYGHPFALQANHFSQMLPWAEGEAAEVSIYDEVPRMIRAEIEFGDDKEEARTRMYRATKALVQGLENQVLALEASASELGVCQWGYYEGDPEGDKLHKEALRFKEFMQLPELTDGNLN